MIMEAPSPWHISKSQIPEGMQVFSINHIVCINILGRSEPLLSILGVVKALPKSRFLDTSKPFSGWWLRPAMLSLLSLLVLISFLPFLQSFLPRSFPSILYSIILIRWSGLTPLVSYMKIPAWSCAKVDRTHQVLLKLWTLCSWGGHDQGPSFIN